MLLNGIGDQGAIDARMKAQGRERDDLKQELASLPSGNKIILHGSGGGTRTPDTRIMIPLL
jgi:hypothetical protein